MPLENNNSTGATSLDPELSVHIGGTHSQFGPNAPSVGVRNTTGDTVEVRGCEKQMRPGGAYDHVFE